MTPDCSSIWQEILPITGTCIKPGGFALTEKALANCQLGPDSLIADVGCGAGGTLEYLGQLGLRRSIGVDSSQALLYEAGRRVTSERLICGRAEALALRAGLFDAVFCECVLSISSDRSGSLHECGRILRDYGFLIVSDVFRLNRSGGETEMQNPRLRSDGFLKKDTLLHHLRSLGFDVIVWEEHQRLLTEFVGTLILQGVSPQRLWACQGNQGAKRDLWKDISYFLLVARKDRRCHD